MNNRKGDLYDVLFFAMAVIFFSMISVILYGISSPAPEPIRKINYEGTASVVPEAVANSPNCLLHTEKVEMNGQERIDFDRNVIDWSYIDNAHPDCMYMGHTGYLWNATIKDLSTGNKSRVGRDMCSSDNYKVLERSVLIKKPNGEIHPGKMTTRLDSRDFEAEFVKREGKTVLSIKNIGSCSTQYNYVVHCIDENGNELSTSDDSSLSLSSGESKNTSTDLLCSDDDASYLRANIYPDSASNFKKTYYSKPE